MRRKWIPSLSFSFSLLSSLSLSVPLQEGNTLSWFCAPLAPVASLLAQSSYLFSLPSREDRSYTFDYLSFIPISNRNGENSGTERAALLQLSSTRKFLLFRSTFACITFYSAKYATSRINARGCAGTLARRMNKRKGSEEISVVCCPFSNMSYYVI